MKKVSSLAAILLILAAPVSAAPETEWKALKSDHFIVYSESGDSAFAGEVLKRAENYYDQIAGWLGYSRRESFWTWENRCKIYIYKSKEGYLKMTGQPAWSGGVAFLNRRMIISFLEAPNFLESILPHEMTHLIFRDFVGDTNLKVPLWLDEGIAMAQEKTKRAEFETWVHQMAKEKKWIQMEHFMGVQSIGDAPSDQAALFYAQAQSVVRFLVDGYGSARFAGFCRSLRDSELPEEALRKNYPTVFPSLASFETRWVEYISQKAIAA